MSKSELHGERNISTKLQSKILLDKNIAGNFIVAPQQPALNILFV